MISSITSGMLIYDKLKQNQELKKLIKDRIYPILPQQKTESIPYIHKRNRIWCLFKRPISL